MSKPTYTAVVPRDNPYFRDHSWHVHPHDCKGICCDDYDIACESFFCPFLFNYGLLHTNAKFASVAPDAYELTSSDDDDDNDFSSLQHNNNSNFSRPFEPAQAAASAQPQLSTRKKKSKIQEGIVSPGEEFDYGKFAQRIRYGHQFRVIRFGGDNNIPVPTSYPPSDGTLSKYGRSKWRSDRSCCCHRFSYGCCVGGTLLSFYLGPITFLMGSMFLLDEAAASLAIPKPISEKTKNPTDHLSSFESCMKGTMSIPEKVCGVENDCCKFAIMFPLLGPWIYSVGPLVHCYLNSVQIARELRHRQQFDGGMICAQASDPVPTKKMARAVQQIFSIKELGNTKMKSAFVAWRIIGITMSYLPKDVNRYEIFRNRYPWTHENPVKVTQME